MAEHKKLGGGDLTVKPFLTQVRRTGSYVENGEVVKGDVVESELEIPSFKEDDALDTLLDGVDSHEIEAGREKLLSENPALASQQVHDYLDEAAASMDFDSTGGVYASPKKEAAVKRVGMILDRETGDSLRFKRMAGGSQVELADPDSGEVLDTLASNEFDTLLETGEYIIS